MIKIVPVKTKVKTVIGGIEGLITGVCIRDNYLSYEMSYFLNGKAESCWMQRYEFTTEVDPKNRPGLVNYDKPNPENEISLMIELPSPK